MLIIGLLLLIGLLLGLLGLLLGINVILIPLFRRYLDGNALVAASCQLLHWFFCNVNAVVFCGLLSYFITFANSWSIYVGLFLVISV